MHRSFLPRILVTLLLFAASAARLEAAEPWLAIDGAAGLGKGQHIVFVTGEEYYRSEEGMSMFAKIMARRHGFRCTVLFATDPETGLINPNRNQNIPGLERLADADLMVNAMLSLTGHEGQIPDRTDVNFVDPYEPHPTGAISDAAWAQAKLTPASFALQSK